MQAQQNKRQAPANIDQHLKELRERFARLIYKLGWNNTKGSERYNFEVEFAYALNEVRHAPPYVKEKLLDKANNVVNALNAYIKSDKEPTE